MIKQIPGAGAPKIAEHRRYLIAALILTALCPFELWGTAHSGSLTLLGDAFHVGADALAGWLSFLVVWSARRTGTLAAMRRRRAQGTLVNGILLCVTALVVAGLGTTRILSGKHTMDAHQALAVIAIGITVNLVVYFWVYGRQSAHSDELHESARWHALSDALCSLVALASAELVVWTGLTLWDPLLSLASAGLLLWKGREFVIRAKASLRDEYAKRSIK